MAARNSRPEPGHAGPDAHKAGADKLAHLTKRADFLAAARDIRKVAGAVTLELTPTPEAARRDGQARIGFTASRKIGNAVARNRAKRRLRAASRASPSPFRPRRP